MYTNDSTELQTRKLGDLYFMFGNYSLAFQVCLFLKLKLINTNNNTLFMLITFYDRLITKQNVILMLILHGNIMLVHLKWLHYQLLCLALLIEELMII